MMLVPPALGGRKKLNPLPAKKSDTHPSHPRAANRNPMADKLSVEKSEALRESVIKLIGESERLKKAAGRVAEEAEKLKKLVPKAKGHAKPDK